MMPGQWRRLSSLRLSSLRLTTEKVLPMALSAHAQAGESSPEFRICDKRHFFKKNVEKFRTNNK